VNLINSSDELDLEKLKKWQPQFKDAKFTLEDGKYIVGREIQITFVLSMVLTVCACMKCF